MLESSDKNRKSEIERIVDLDRLGRTGAALDIVASEGECAALAKRFDFLDLKGLAARVTVDLQLGGQIVIEGRLRGKVVQACVLTLEPVVQELDDVFRIVFRKNLAEELDPESGETVLNPHVDAPEPLAGNMLDVGEIVAEQLSLVAEPYPRRPGVKLEDILPKPKGGARRGAPGQQRHPFAGLAALRDKPRHGR
jgi:hypothetical protein